MSILDVLSQIQQIAIELYRVRDEFQRKLSEWAPRFIEAFEAIPDTERVLLNRLAAHGWYPEPWTMTTSQLVTLAAMSDGAEVDRHLCRVFTRELASIEERLTKAHPGRARILSQAFAAHRDGRYALSVPVFLAQADGLCYEKTEGHLYNARALLRLLDEFAAAGGDRFAEAALAPFAPELPISANQRARSTMAVAGRRIVGPNRHLVLHGVDTDYDTEENSLRAVAWLQYVNYVFFEEGGWPQP
ncbi:MAG: hypothetical protein V1694_01115 [Candidatus Eisenbacteria bacterium]